MDILRQNDFLPLMKMMICDHEDVCEHSENKTNPARTGNTHLINTSTFSSASVSVSYYKHTSILMRMPVRLKRNGCSLLHSYLLHNSSAHIMQGCTMELKYSQKSSRKLYNTNNTYAGIDCTCTHIHKRAIVDGTPFLKL